MIGYTKYQHYFLPISVYHFSIAKLNYLKFIYELVYKITCFQTAI